ncbi:hypothetical protein GCM10009743_00780 [Kribbella swartbergensis]
MTPRALSELLPPTAFVSKKANVARDQIRWCWHYCGSGVGTTMGGGHGIASTDDPTDMSSSSTGIHLYRSLDRGTPYLGDTSGKPQPKVGCGAHPPADSPADVQR